MGLRYLNLSFQIWRPDASFGVIRCIHSHPCEPFGFVASSWPNQTRSLYEKIQKRPYSSSKWETCFAPYFLRKPNNCLRKQLLKGVKVVPKPGQAINFPAPFIHLCYSAYWESALTEPELFKYFPANIPFRHLTLIADPTCSANKHRSQFSKGTSTPNIIIYHVDIWLGFEYTGYWERRRMGFLCAVTAAEWTALKTDDVHSFTKQDRVRWASDELGENILVFWVPMERWSFLVILPRHRLSDGDLEGVWVIPRLFSLPLCCISIRLSQPPNQTSQAPQGHSMGTQPPTPKKSPGNVGVLPCISHSSSRRISCHIILINEVEQGDGMGFFELRCG